MQNSFLLTSLWNKEKQLLISITEEKALNLLYCPRNKQVNQFYQSLLLKKRIDQLIPVSLIQQHIKDDEFTLTRRKGLFCRMKTILLKHTHLVRTLNYWTKKSNRNQSPSKKSTQIKFKNSINPIFLSEQLLNNLKTERQTKTMVQESQLKQTQLVGGRQSNKFEWSTHQNPRMSEQFDEESNQQLNSKRSNDYRKKIKQPTIEYSSSSEGSQQDSHSNQIISKKNIQAKQLRNKYFDIIQKGCFRNNEVVNQYIRYKQKFIASTTLTPSASFGNNLMFKSEPASLISNKQKLLNVSNKQISSNSIQQIKAIYVHTCLNKNEKKYSQQLSQIASYQLSFAQNLKHKKNQRTL